MTPVKHHISTKVSSKFSRMSEVYKVFSKDWQHMLFYSEESKLELFNHETFGRTVSKTNGYYVGKKWLNVHVEMWKEDIENELLYKIELYEDPKFPHWWLDSIFK